MAKYTHSFSVKGELDAESLEVLESSKETVETHSLADVLHGFHGKVVSITIKEETVAMPVEENFV